MAALQLGIPERRAYVVKRGLPFYDAARLWGASVLLFGESTCRVVDRGSLWELSGYDVRREPEQTEWVRARLTGRGLERIEETTLHLVDSLAERYDEVVRYFDAPPAARTATADTNISRYVEPAFLRGSRGPESWSYGSLASERGSGVDDAYPEVLAAVVGICLAGLGSAGGDRLFVLPVPDAGSERPVALGPFLRFTPELHHQAGGIVGPVALSLHVLRQIGDRIAISEFAYARFGRRGFYESGYLGMGTLLRSWQREGRSDGPARAAIRDIAAALWNTRQTDESRRTRNKENKNDSLAIGFARALALFALQPSVAYLESAARFRVRCIAGRRQDTPAVAERRTRAARIWMDDDSLKGVLNLAGMEPDVMPDQLKALAANVGRALKYVGDDASGRGWVGWYMRLEHAPNRERFFREVERLLARSLVAPPRSADEAASDDSDAAAAAGIGASVGERRRVGWIPPSQWYRRWPEQRAWSVWERRHEWSGAAFRELRTAFLLEVQRELARGAGRRARPLADGEVETGESQPEEEVES